MPLNLQDIIKLGLVGSGSGGSSGGGGGSSGGGNIDEKDGATYLYISLAEGRTSPMLGASPDGTMLVDWGDGTEPDTLTGTGSVKWTPPHAYKAPGDYVIRITGDGTHKFAGSSSSNGGSRIIRHTKEEVSLNKVYQNALKRVVFGENASADGAAFYNCAGLSSADLSKSRTSVYSRAFYNCNGLASVIMPQGSLSVSEYTFYGCYGLKFLDFTACTSIPSLNATSAFASIPDDCEIRVPAALYDEWIAATNWATYASQINGY